MSGSMTAGYGIVVAITDATINELILARQIVGTIPRIIDLVRDEPFGKGKARLQAHITIEVSAHITTGGVDLDVRASPGSLISVFLVAADGTVQPFGAFAIRGCDVQLDLLPIAANPNVRAWLLKPRSLQLDSELPAVLVDAASAELLSQLSAALTTVLPEVPVSPAQPRVSCAQSARPAPVNASLHLMDGELQVLCEMPGDTVTPGIFPASLAWNGRATVTTSNQFLLRRIVRGAIEDWLCEKGVPLPLQLWPGTHPCLSITPVPIQVTYGTPPLASTVTVTSVAVAIQADRLVLTATAEATPLAGIHALVETSVELAIRAEAGTLRLDLSGDPKVKVDAYAEPWVYVLAGLIIGPFAGAIKKLVDDGAGWAQEIAAGPISDQISSYLGGKPIVLPYGVRALEAELDDLRVAVSLTDPALFAVVSEGGGTVEEGQAFDLDFPGGAVTYLGASGADIGWSSQAPPLGLTAGANARIAPVIGVTFENLEPIALARLTNWTNALPVSAVPYAGAEPLLIAVETDEGRKAKCLVWREGEAVRIRFVTYYGNEPLVELRGSWKVIASEEIASGTEPCQMGTAAALGILGGGTPGSVAGYTATFKLLRVSRRGEFEAHTQNIPGALAYAWALDGALLETGPLDFGGVRLDVAVNGPFCSIVTPLGGALAGTISVAVTSDGTSRRTHRAIHVSGTMKEGGCPPPRQLSRQQLRELEILIFEILHGGRVPGQLPERGPDPVPIIDFAALLRKNLLKH